MRSPKWEALTQIITKFIEAGHPRLAVLALTVVMIASLGAAVAVGVSAKSAVCATITDRCPRP